MDVLVVMLLAMAWGLPLLVLHELGHAVAALHLTRGEIGVHVDFRGGRCVYDSDRLERPRAEAWIAVAGPAVSLLAAAVITWAALEAEGIARTLLKPGAFASWFLFFTSAIPMRYGAGLRDEGASESDGRAIWRILTGAPPGDLAREERRLGRPERQVHPLLAVAGLAVLLLAFVVDAALGAMLAAIFGVAWLFQLSDVKKH
jgi:hypothetical protein